MDGKAILVSVNSTNRDKKLDNAMIRVCYVLSTSEKSGGANKSLLDLLRNLDRKRIRPYVLLRRHGDIEEELLALNIAYSIIPYINSVTTGKWIKDFAKRISYHVVLPRIKKYYRQNKIDIVHNNSFPALAGMEAAYDLGIPYICHIREDVEKGLGVHYLNKKKHLEIANAAIKKIAISQFIKNSYLDDIDDAIVLYDGMNTKAYFEEKDILKKTPIVMSIYGNLDEQKGQKYAIQAVSELERQGLDSIRLRIVGNLDTEYGRKVIGYVKENNIQSVEFVDTIREEGLLKDFRQQDDINIVCSRAEGLGRVTIEGMLAGSLIIAANAGATKEIVENRNTGLLFSLSIEHSLSETIQYALCHPELMRKIAKNGQKHALYSYGIENYSAKMCSIYQKVCEDRAVY